MKRNPKTRVDEAKLVSFARSYLAEDFPNPDRIGCPPLEMLRRLAEQPTSADLSITEHLGGCSPCFRQYQEMLTETRAEKKSASILSRVLVLTPRFVALAVAIGLAIIGLSVAVWLSHKREVVHQEPNRPKINLPNNERNRVAEFSPFILDMTNASQVRGTNRRDRSALKMPRKPLHISVYLPIGSDAGEYRVSLNTRKQSAWSGAGTAQMRDKRMILEFEADLSSYQPGRYMLTLLSQSGLRLKQQVVLEDQAKAK
jgi:hypothetical protein